MKKLTAITLIVIFWSCASLTKEEKEAVKIIEFPGLKKDVIYKKSLEWLAEKWGSSKDIIELQDREEGKIIGKVIFTVGSFAPCPVYNNLVIEIKDGRARVKIEVLTISNPEGSMRSSSVDASWRDEIKDQQQEILIAYEAYIKEKTSKKEEW